MSEKVRAHVLIRGWVQGVAFRYKTRNAAIENGVTGWVRNKADGSVEAVFEGDRVNVEDVVRWCENGPPMAVVKDLDIQWEKYVGEFSEFDIRF
jgi:acylphosphatase